jgi:1-(5-phosphoribosyl)-5-[(5-phosphoribosylamino)methylideneamino] imidazole-4-carboxamide isomerase/N-(5'phosphoribosyl)anthranilate isomerase
VSANSFLTLLPAIDISDGQAVRLVRGKLDEQTKYAHPEEVAEEFAEVYSQYPGENWVHLVDLDAAFGRGENQAIIKNVVEILRSGNVHVEVSGGIRSDGDLDRAISIGATRVNVGTSALEDPDWTARAIKKYGDKLAIGLDVRGETLAARGWVKDGGNLWEVLERLLQDGATRFVVTDVNKDGTLQGPNLELLTQIASRTASFDVKITASGGISELDDLKQLKTLMENTQNIVDSAIFGKALYAKKFTLAEAISVVR